MNEKNKICPNNLKVTLPRVLFIRGGKKRIRIERTKKITPNNLSGIDRRMAYANKKYHSGTMWVGVSMGLAKIKFSGSPKKKGAKKIKISINKKKKKKNQTSFELKNQ
jgi:hypothetical protein